MDAASHEEWPVRRLARVSGVSEAHFARSFKEAFGVPPHRYLLTRRIERATAMLRDTDLPIIEIAFPRVWSPESGRPAPRRRARPTGRQEVSASRTASPAGRVRASATARSGPPSW